MTGLKAHSVAGPRPASDSAVTDAAEPGCTQHPPQPQGGDVQQPYAAHLLARLGQLPWVVVASTLLRLGQNI
jgi:hypothetical protein